MRILIVDDDDIALAMLANVLRQSGYEVLMASHGRQALEILDADGVHFVITDWEMPQMNGLELCSAIRRGTYNHYIYTILLTAHGRAEEIVAGLSAGADDYIAKPFNPAELTARVKIGERILSLETRDLAIFAMAKLVESRDSETGAHLERVRSYSRLLAVRLSQDPDFAQAVTDGFIRLIYTTSPLHDIGKVGIPDAILLKPGALDVHERRIMMSHTTRGAATLEAALRLYPEAGFLHMARDIAASHHEWFDGTGYPKGLRGEAIPLSARIVALADVYDALTNARPYKAAMTHDEATALIRAESGAHFDPRIVDAFNAIVTQFVEVHDRYAELEEACSRTL